MQSFAGNNNIKLLQAFNHRASKQTKLFSKQFNCSVLTNYANLNTTANLYIIAVKDDAIAEVAKNLRPLKLTGCVVHTSGSVNLNVLKNTSTNIGVYYPLQTFYTNAIINWQITPILVEASTPSVLLKLTTIAKLVSKKVKQINSAQRMQIHLAAVFACNFTNALYVSAFELIEKNVSKKDVDLLLPLIEASFNKLKTTHPVNAQTGPAMRNDTVVLKKHLQILKTDKQLSSVYKNLSNLIVQQQTNRIK